MDHPRQITNMEDMHMFGKLEMAPPDPILGLEEAFQRDPNPAKINLSVGVYKDAQGNTPIFSTIKKAEAQLLTKETSKNYLSIPGSSEYARAVQQLVLGETHEALDNQRVATAHTPGGTGALRVAADFLRKNNLATRIWVSQPTWPNHPNVFRAAGLGVETYPYFDPSTNGIAFDALLAALRQIPEGEVVLLHGCCHNPTGIDPSPDQWHQIADVLESRRLLPLVDFAYQGLGEGIREDAQGVLTLCRPGAELLIASSFSKNFGLYNERVGALTLVAKTAGEALSAFSQIKSCIRANYSNPPFHGGAIVAIIMLDAALRKEWEGEVQAMRDRINQMRKLMVNTLAAQKLQQDFSFIQRQRGMFSFSGLTKQQVLTLRNRYSIYIVDSGRINVAGMTESNMEIICRAIAEVL
jgi:aspartate/tyrosine/aromatic aminotransferase